MPQPPRQITPAGGIFAALIVVFLFGFFVGLWVATAGQRAQERATHQPQADRPWRSNRSDEK